LSETQLKKEKQKKSYQVQIKIFKVTEYLCLFLFHTISFSCLFLTTLRWRNWQQLLKLNSDLSKSLHMKDPESLIDIWRSLKICVYLPRYDSHTSFCRGL